MRVIAIVLLLAGCASEASAVDRPDVKKDREGAVPDDTAGGRDRTFESCMAACSNTSFSCNEGGISSVDGYLAIETLGCRGQLGTQALVLDCHAQRVCVDDDCQDASFSAMTFAWKKTVCTRN